MQVRNQKLQSIDFAQLVQKKKFRQRALREHFTGKSRFSVYITEAHFRTLHLVANGALVEERFDLKSVLEDGSVLRFPELDGNIIILSNSDVDSDHRMTNFSLLYDAHPETLFVAWDSDNHHTLQISMALAALVDFYVQAHPENFYDLSRFNSLRAYVPLGVSFISRIDSMRLWERVSNSLRVDKPRGYFARHEVFEWRNRIVATLAERCENVGFIDMSNSIKSGEMSEYFEEMIGFKVHWVVPALDDVSGRIFEILLSGGIPLLPESLRFHPGLEGVPPECLGFYSLDDVIEPGGFLSSVIGRFDKEGSRGIRARFECAISNHSDVRLRKILGLASHYFGFMLGSA